MFAGMCTKGSFLCLLIAVAVSADVHEKGLPITIEADNWQDILEGEWLVKFHAPWCPACRSLESIWQNIAGWCTDIDIRIGQVAVATNPGLTGRFMVKTLPTIYHIKDGIFRQYTGLRDEYELISFLDDKKWHEIKPLPWYRNPTSLPMGFMSHLFEMATRVSILHSTMVTAYGFPLWMSYMAFASITVFLGFTLGLAVVYLCDKTFDYLFPAATPHALSQLLWTQRIHDVGAGGDTKEVQRRTSEEDAAADPFWEDARLPVY